LKRNSSWLIAKILGLVIVIGAAAGLATRPAQGCKACMTVWSQGGQQSTVCVACGHLGFVECVPDGEVCQFGNMEQCDPNPGNEIRIECP
jgi:hypothetical protein